LPDPISALFADPPELQRLRECHAFLVELGEPAAAALVAFRVEDSRPRTALTLLGEALRVIAEKGLGPDVTEIDAGPYEVIVGLRRARFVETFGEGEAPYSGSAYRQVAHVARVLFRSEVGATAEVSDVGF
jgi:hypothetical protein